MKIERLKLTNFRNYNHLELDFTSNINIFIGNNGQGKTNILESIYVLSLSKSNRYGLDSDLIQFDKDSTKIEGLIKNDDLLKKQEIVITKLKKQLYINGKEIRKNRDYISNFCVISFNPDDLQILKGSPSIRRNIMNIDISQLYNNYINYLNEYNSIIKIRNEYLKKINLNGNSDYRYLEIINDKLIENADKIYNYRFSFLDKINKNINTIYKKITGLENLSIKYENNLNLDEYNHEEIIKRFKGRLKRYLNQELLQGITLTGPHRDDFIFLLNGMDMKNYASQGQQRMAIIAFKISEIYIFKQVLGSYPVLLLDDIFSEIDTKKRNKIIKFLKNDIQTIITTTDINDIDSSLLVNSTVYNISNNKVTKKGRINNGRKSK